MNTEHYISTINVRRSYYLIVIRLYIESVYFIPTSETDTYQNRNRARLWHIKWWIVYVETITIKNPINL